MELLERNRKIRRYGLVGVDVDLFKEACHFGVCFEVLKAQTKPSVSLSTCRSGCSFQLLLQYLPVRCHAPNRDD